MARLCERPGCSERGSVAYGFDADRLLVWLASFDPEAERMRAGVLCKRHADSMVVPIAWVLDDRRDSKPALFRTPRATRRKRPGRRTPAAAAPRPVAEQPGELPLQEGDAADVTRPMMTVADISGAQPDDPDATVALPWMPVLDVDDGASELLRADSPLLARAFQGTRRRPTRLR